MENSSSYLMNFNRENIEPYAKTMLQSMTRLLSPPRRFRDTQFIICLLDCPCPQNYTKSYLWISL